MKSLVVCFSIAIFLVTACKNKEHAAQQNISQCIKTFDPEIHQILDTSATIDTLAEGFTWSEGPLWLSDVRKLIFSDVPENKLYAWDEKNGIQEYLHPSGFTLKQQIGSKEGANGLLLDLEGHLLLCQHGNRALAKMMAPLNAPKDSFEFLAHHFKDKKFNSPNDLHQTKDGDIFFTDPPYGLPNQDQDTNKELPYNGVYRYSKNGSIVLLDSTLSRPNGITFSKDEKWMYVANSDEKEAIWMQYRLDANKNIIEKKVFADVTSMLTTLKGLPDGMKINKKGYIFATGPGGILIFHPDGRHLGTILTGQATANCALDAEERYLYMTAHSYLMRIALKP